MRIAVKSIVSVILVVNLVSCGEGDTNDGQSLQNKDFNSSVDLKNQVDLNEYNVPIDDRLESLDNLKALKEKLVKLENNILAPAREDLDEYRDILSSGDVKIVRLLGSRTVSQTSGGGNYYSFGFQTHAYGYGSDISLRGGQFKVGFAGTDYGFFTNLGDIDITDVDASTPGVEFAYNYKAPSIDNQARKEYRRFGNGVNHKGFEYKSRVNIQNGDTYSLRSIAYRDYDILVVFKVVRIDESDNSVILLWKKLKKYKTPNLQN